MNIHEYQAKQWLANYGCPVPKGAVVTSKDAVADVMADLGLSRVVVKAQVHAGGRGKAGGVAIVDGVDAAAEAVEGMLGRRLVTYQTSTDGQPVHDVLLEAPSDIQRELYLGAVVDRARQQLTLMASTEGGVDIEHVAATTPEKIITVPVDPTVGLQPFQCRQMAFALGLDKAQAKTFANMVGQLARLFVERDLSLLEINPLVVTGQGDLICLDCKMNIDDNALYRQPELLAMRDASQEDPREEEAQRHALNYIALEGNIGCMVNGAGLAMATMDLIKLHGGAPANFLDVGGTATAERVREAFRLILSDTHVKAVLVNIFGGIVRCDMIADGIIDALATVDVNVPVVVRLDGTMAEEGAKKLASSGLDVLAATGFEDAAKQVVAAASR